MDCHKILNIYEPQRITAYIDPADLANLPMLPKTHHLGFLVKYLL